MLETLQKDRPSTILLRQNAVRRCAVSPKHGETLCSGRAVSCVLWKRMLLESVLCASRLLSGRWQMAVLLCLRLYHGCNCIVKCDRTAEGVDARGDNRIHCVVQAPAARRTPFGTAGSRHALTARCHCTAMGLEWNHLKRCIGRLETGGCRPCWDRARVRRVARLPRVRPARALPAPAGGVVTAEIVYTFDTMSVVAYTGA